MSLKVKPMQIARSSSPLECPPDKSVTHRSFLFSLLSSGKSVIRKPLLGQDCLASLGAVRKLGARVDGDGDLIEITGFGIRDFGRQPSKHAPLIIDCQNSGTTIRLLSGLLAGQHGYFRLVGDESLSRRPMARVAVPLKAMGAAVFTCDSRGGGADKSAATPPIDVEPAPGGLCAKATRLNVASAQVKSALLLAGLFCRDGETAVNEPSLSRDHTERMLREMGVEVRASVLTDGRAVASLDGAAGRDLKPLDLTVGGDPSSAAFWAAAAVMQDRRVCIENVLLNPTRLGFAEVLRLMGAPIKARPMSNTGGEMVGAIEVTGCGTLCGVEVPAALIPTMIDEVPMLAITSLWASGTTVFRGVQELRVKESDRLEAVIHFIESVGGHAWTEDNDLFVEGRGRAPAGPSAPEWSYETLGDHRLAMAAVVTADALRKTIVLDDAECIRVSYPSFFKHREILSK